MQLDRLNLALRRRSPWEALDLGLAMLRRWRGPVYRTWFAICVPFALLLQVVFWQQPLIAALVFWWLKPLYDRILLKVFAEASFDAAPGLRDIWRAIPGLLRHSGLFMGLTLRRFSMSRSFELPIWQLEGQRGAAGRARRRVISRRTEGYATWLTFVCVHFVLIFEFGIVALISIFQPVDAPEVFSWTDFFNGDLDPWRQFAFNLAWIAAESIVEPFFVAAGFSLYLNRRNDLEGWDIEVAFRRLSERQARGSNSLRPETLGVTLLLASLLTLLPAADAPAAPASTREEIRRQVDQVLADPVFGRRGEEMTWRKREQTKAEGEDWWWVKYLAWFAEKVAELSRLLAYLAVGLALIAAIVFLYRRGGFRLAWRRQAASPRPEMLFGLDVRPESLPADVAAAARAEIAAGRIDAALSLLYRGALVRLIDHHGIEFMRGDTEDTCLQRVRGHLPADAGGYFGKLIEAWKATAYGHLPPATEVAFGLADHWPEHFSSGGGATA